MNKIFPYLIFIITIFCAQTVFAQFNPTRSGGGGRGLTNLRNIGGGGGGGTDSLQSRAKYDDSITITYKLPDAVRPLKLDSSVSDYTKRFPIPAHHINLGNDGTATKSLLFSPLMKAGWDAGFHAFDVYKWTQDQARFYNTTRPYTEIQYALGSRTEQILGVTHTQNIKPNWNALFQYRLINSPGFFQNQKTNHNNYLLTSWYQSINKRYNNYISLVSNKLQAGENGGIKTDMDYLNDKDFKDRFNIPVKLGESQSFGRDFFKNTLSTGNRYKEFSVVMKQQYDLGRKDSLVTDSTVVPLFYPRLRFQHTLTYSSNDYLYLDVYAGSDSVYYKDTLNIEIANQSDTVTLNDKWKELINDFSIYQFPDANNLQQYITAGIAFQTLSGRFPDNKNSFYNLFVHGAYANKSKNGKWDITANGALYLNGLNAGDYNAEAGLKRVIPKTGAFLELGFKTVNRTPSFIYNSRSSFYKDAATSFNKENISNILVSFYYPKIGLTVRGDYFLVSNYTYLTDYYKLKQASALFNVLHISAEKIFKVGRKWRWYNEVHLQQRAGNAEVNLPLIFTRQRFALEGVFYKNLNISTGIELRYATPYYADGYSPFLGKFFYQDSIKIKNLPEIAAYINFRIRSFNLFFRAENLNSVTTSPTFGFINKYQAVPDYPYPGLAMKLGIFWNFIN